jgi:sugar phosphate isomerase/epimerase
VFGGPVPDAVSRDQARATLVGGLRTAGEHAARRGVTVLLETHDDWSCPQQVAEVMEAVGHPSVGTLWDVWHTGRAGKATVTDSYRALAPWIRHVQMHDGLLRQDRLDFRRIGTGEVDHLEMLLNLHAGGYQGAISGEWIDWEPAEQHLPRDLAAMQRYEALINAPQVDPAHRSQPAF